MSPGQAFQALQARCLGKRPRQAIAQLITTLLEHLHRDALTGLLNYAGGIVQLQQAIAQAERYHTPLSLLMLDRDHNIHSVSDLPHLYTCVEVDRQVFQWDGAAYVLAESCDDLKLQENSYRCR